MKETQKNVHKQLLCYCVTLALRKTPLLIYGITNNAKIVLFIGTTKRNKIIFVKTLNYALLLKRTMDVAIVRTDGKFFLMDR